MRVNNKEGEMIPCPSSPTGEEGRVDEGTRGLLYSFDDLPEGFPIRMGPEVDLFKPFHIDSSGMIFQHSDGTPTLLPMGRGDSLGKADKGRKQQGRKKNGKQQGNQPIAPLSNWAGVNPIGRGTSRDLRLQGMGHSKDKPTQMQMHEFDYDYDKPVPSKTKELDKVIENEEEIKIADENNDAKFAAFLEKELAYSARDEVRNHYMQVDPVHIEQPDTQSEMVIEKAKITKSLGREGERSRHQDEENTEKEKKLKLRQETRQDETGGEPYEKQFMEDLTLLHWDLMIDEMLIVLVHTPPKPNQYYRWRKSTSILGSRLKQLRIKGESMETSEELTLSDEGVHVNERESSLPASKHNKSRMSASIARRLLNLIRSHFRKKGLG